MMELHYGLYTYLFNIVLKGLVVRRRFLFFFLNNEHVIFPQELLEPLEDKVASSELLEITKDWWPLDV